MSERVRLVAEVVGILLAVAGAVTLFGWAPVAVAAGFALVLIANYYRRESTEDGATDGDAPRDS
jgi:uncharacterized membrane protein YphA (DoxX/SURF4 family)